MDLRDRVNVVQAKMNGAVAALTYGYFSHTNDTPLLSSEFEWNPLFDLSPFYPLFCYQLALSF